MDCIALYLTIINAWMFPLTVNSLLTIILVQPYKPANVITIALIWGCEWVSSMQAHLGN